MIDLTGIDRLLGMLRSGAATPTGIVEEVLDAIALSNRPEAWLCVLDRDQLLARARELEENGHEGLALYGIPFAVKDNIDVAGIATTAGCPAYAYIPQQSADVVTRLLAAGAMLIGKTHMDQFATGLVGTRSPHGPCRNAHHPRMIAGGSSSGSAVVVAQSIVTFALGTDTAGSGRVSAVLNGVVGLKPTRGLVSTTGVVPACASLDCVSVFAQRCEDAGRVLDVAAQAPPREPRKDGGASAVPHATFRFGVPSPAELASLDADARTLFADAIAALQRAGGVAVEIDYSPLRETAALLYSRGAWLAERNAAFGDFLRAHPDAVDPTVAAIVRGAEGITRAEIEASMRRLAELQTEAAPLWQKIDVLVVPTVPQLFRIADVLAAPLEASPKIGVFNNFANLLDLSAIAVPTGSWPCGVPFGVTLCAPAHDEAMLLRLGAALESHVTVPHLVRPTWIELAVVGAHLRGMPLHHQLTERRARLVAATRTSPDYRLYAIAETSPPKPGLCRVTDGGASIEVEVWSLAPAEFASFVAAVPRPLAIGKLTIEGGAEVSGFVCEPGALAGALDITAFGGWRAYCQSQARAPKP